MKDFTILDLLNKIKHERRLLTSINEGLGYNLRTFIDDVELSIRHLISDKYFKMDDGYISDSNNGLTPDTKKHVKVLDLYINKNIAPYNKKEKKLIFKIFKNKVYRALKIR